MRLEETENLLTVRFERRISCSFLFLRVCITQSRVCTLNHTRLALRVGDRRFVCLFGRRQAASDSLTKISGVSRAQDRPKKKQKRYRVVGYRPFCRTVL